MIVLSSIKVSRLLKDGFLGAKNPRSTLAQATNLPLCCIVLKDMILVNLKCFVTTNMKSDYMFETAESDYESVTWGMTTKAYNRTAYSSSKTFILDDVFAPTPNEFQSLNIGGN